MKKTLFAVATLGLLLSSVALAQDTSTGSTDSSTATISSVNKDAESQVQALRKEMEDKIKAIRQDYQTKIDAIRKDAKTKADTIRTDLKTKQAAARKAMQDLKTKKKTSSPTPTTPPATQ